MATIKDLKFEPHPIGEGIQAVIEFDNGYGASVISDTRYFYSTPARPYEIAVLYDGVIVYDTPITNDVCGYLTEDEANEILTQIEALPNPPTL